MTIESNASSWGSGAFARLERIVACVLSITLAAGAYAAPPSADASAASSAEIRLVAADAAAGTAVFAVDDALQSIARGESLQGVPLRLTHVGPRTVLIERIDADVDHVAQLQLAVGATLPPAALKREPETPATAVPVRMSTLTTSRPAKSGQGADPDAPN